MKLNRLFTYLMAITLAGCAPLREANSPAAQTDPGEPRRGHLLRPAVSARPRPAPAAGAPAPLPSYDPHRLALAAQLRTFVPVEVENMGIKVGLKAKWASGKLAMRLALVGPRDGLNAFTAQVRQFHIKFTDRTGNPVTEYGVLPSQLAWAPPTVNSGVPTLQFESSVECPLEIYEQVGNWNFYWDY